VNKDQRRRKLTIGAVLKGPRVSEPCASRWSLSAENILRGDPNCCVYCYRKIACAEIFHLHERYVDGCRVRGVNQRLAVDDLPLNGNERGTLMKCGRSMLLRRLP